MARKKVKPPNVLVTDAGPVTGEHYAKLHQKLGIDLGRYLTKLGANIRDHYQIHQDLSAPLADPGLALHVRLIDRYPDLVQPDPTAEELVQQLKEIKRDHPDLKLPMRITPSLVGVLMGRHIRTSSLWTLGRSRPTWKILELMRDLASMLDTCPDPVAFLEEYLELVRVEAAARGEDDVFAAGRWPSLRKKTEAGDDPEAEDDSEAEDDPRFQDDPQFQDD